MNITVLEEPAVEPVTLTEAYEHLRLTPFGSPLSHPDDDMLERQITSARRVVETMAQRSVIRQRLRLSQGCFPACGRGIVLRRPPVLQVLAVRFYDGDNVLQTASTSDWFITDDQLPEIQFGSGWSAPTCFSRSDAVQVEYWAGYAPAGSPGLEPDELRANVPEEIKDAVLLGVQLLYDQLAPEQRAALERTRKALLAPPIGLLSV